ncbi:MAG TPA: thiol-disulfide oxidoreductase ResA [Pseudogracilibacillus sp.]|nr:thiol-disulfide oxidoreductase ResA [Pseudogracilibacillus sp.]
MSTDRKKARQKKKRNRYIFRAAVLAVLIFAIGFAIVSNMNKDKEIYRVGDEAPDFQLSQINEASEIEKIRLSDLRGKGVMLNFWATYCEPCEAEMPFMEELYPQYDGDVEIVAVSLDLNQLVIDKFVNKYDLTFPIVHDKKSEVMDLYKVGPIPSTFFIDPEGKIVEYVSGPLTLDKLEGYFEQIKP